MPLTAQSHTIEHTLFGSDEPLTVDISALDSMLYPTIPQGVPLMDPPPLVPLQSPATTTLADSQSLALHLAAFVQDGEHHKTTAQQVYPPWVSGPSSTVLAEPQEPVLTDAGSPFMSDGSVLSGMLDMSPSQSPENLAPCFYAPALAFDAATMPVPTTGNTLPIDPLGGLDWGGMENYPSSPLLASYSRRISAIEKWPRYGTGRN